MNTAVPKHKIKINYYVTWKDILYFKTNYFLKPLTNGDIVNGWAQSLMDGCDCAKVSVGSTNSPRQLRSRFSDTKSPNRATPPFQSPNASPSSYRIRIPSVPPHRLFLWAGCAFSSWGPLILNSNRSKINHILFNYKYYKKNGGYLKFYFHTTSSHGKIRTKQKTWL